MPAMAIVDTKSLLNIANAPGNRTVFILKTNKLRLVRFTGELLNGVRNITTMPESMAWPNVPKGQTRLITTEGGTETKYAVTNENGWFLVHLDAAANLFLCATDEGVLKDIGEIQKAQKKSMENMTTFVSTEQFCIYTPMS